MLAALTVRYAVGYIIEDATKGDSAVGLGLTEPKLGAPLSAVRW